jgi:hypothetical protein
MATVVNQQSPMTARRHSSHVANSSPSLRVAQANLGKGESATQAILQHDFDVAIISEPYTRKDGLMPSTPNYNCFQVKTTNRVKAAILVAKEIVAIMLTGSDSNNVFVNLNLGNRTIVIASCYWEPDGDVAFQSRAIENFVANNPLSPILVAGDFNGRSAAWGDKHTCPRGTEVEETLAALDTVILNIDSEPTFMRVNGDSSIVDLTAAHPDIARLVANWRVSDLATLSDHFAIEFTIESSPIVETSATLRYNMSKFNSDKFDTEFQSRLGDLDDKKFEEVGDYISLVALISLWTQAISGALDASAPRSKPGRQPNPWWTKELNELRDKANKANKAWRRSRNVANIGDLGVANAIAKEAYKDAIAKSRTESWRSLMATIDPTTAWTKLLKILRAGRRQPPTAVVANGVSTKNQQETLDALMGHFFRKDDPTLDTVAQAALRNVANEISPAADESPFTEHEILDAAKSFSPHKAPGHDGMNATVCRQAIVANIKLATALYNACLRLGCFPSTWKDAVICCIPKPEKNDYTNIKSWRPIGLLPVLGKILEKATIRRLEHHLATVGFAHEGQFGFTAQRSCVDALRQVTEFIGKVRRAKPTTSSHVGDRSYYGDKRRLCDSRQPIANNQSRQPTDLGDVGVVI